MGLFHLQTPMLEIPFALIDHDLDSQIRDVHLLLQNSHRRIDVSLLSPKQICWTPHNQNNGCNVSCTPIDPSAILVRIPSSDKVPVGVA
jgi:hypothetical protein